jgi:hypothetical protein
MAKHARILLPSGALEQKKKRVSRVYGSSNRKATSLELEITEIAWLIVFGSHITPALAPPNGMSITAHFHVIHAASARTSPSVTAR